jgi:phage terminase large subunit-like protein
LASDDAKNWTVLRLAALAEDADPLGRAPGEALCPERYDEAALASMREVLGGYSFNALLQQRATGRRGDVFDPAWFQLVNPGEVPVDGDAVLWFDCGATEDGGDFTTGVLTIRKGPNFWLWPKMHVQKGTTKRDRLMRNVADQVREDRRGASLEVWREQEPGASGKDATVWFKDLMLGHNAKTEPTSGSKEVGAMGMSAAAENGRIHLVRSPHTSQFLEESRQFPRAAHDDLIESGYRGFNVLARQKERRRAPLSSGYVTG